MNGTYKAVEVSTPGVLRVVERPISKPAAAQVRLRVEACGVCHPDLATVQEDYPGLKLPRVPGHEVVGRIEEIGPNVSKWKIGQRVGVGFLGGQDSECEPCLRGDFANCLNPVISGITTDGGYADVMIAEARALATIPDELTSVEAAPLLCAGITTYNALRNAGLRAGDLVGIQGIGGLGHLGVQFARRMGFRTVAINNGPEKAELAKELGAHSYVDAAAEDVAAAFTEDGRRQSDPSDRSKRQSDCRTGPGPRSSRQVDRGWSRARRHRGLLPVPRIRRALDLWQLDGQRHRHPGYAGVQRPAGCAAHDRNASA